MRPVSLPANADGTLSFLDDDLVAEVSRLLEGARRDGRWTKPKRVLFDPGNPEFWAYTVFKTGHPTVEPLAGSGLGAHFAPFRQSHFQFPEEGFYTERSTVLSAVGDLMSTPPNIERSSDRLYRNVAREIFDADVRYANLESILAAKPGRCAGAPESTPVTSATPGQLEALVQHDGAHFDVLHLSNNHTMDFGDEPLAATLRYLDEGAIRALGINQSAEERGTPQVTEHEGIRIGWVAHTYGLNGQPQPADKPWRVNVVEYHTARGADLASVEATIGAARAEGCDLVIVSVHWGAEWECYPLPEQVKSAHRYAEAGADALIGHHPHVIQPVEIYRPDSDPEKAVPIIYSLGNLTPVLSHPATALAMVARLQLSTGHRRGQRRTRISGLRLIPLVTLENGARATAIPELHTLANLVGRTWDADMSAYIDALVFYADRVLGADWRQP